MQQPDITRLMTEVCINQSKILPAPVVPAAYCEALPGIIQTGIAQGEFRLRPPPELAMGAWASMHGFAMLAVSSLLEVDIDDKTALDTLIRCAARDVNYGIVN